MFREYLKEIAGKSVQSVNRFVLGNSSVDYDTFFGSIILAFLLTKTTNVFHLPLIDCKEQELHHRLQIKAILKHLSIDSTIFPYKAAISETPAQSLFNLYDHNFRKQLERVDLVVDHHSYDHITARKFLICRMGSALTHLYFLLYPSKLQQIQPSNEEEAKYIHLFHDFIREEPFGQRLFEKNPQQQVEELIRYGILMDTFNFDIAQKQRWTVFDQKAVEFIEKERHFQIGFKELQEFKFDVAQHKTLSLDESLSMDYKMFDYGGTTIQYSIIYFSPEEYLSHYEEGLKKFIRAEQKGDVYIMMGLFKGPKGAFQRELVFRTKQPQSKLNGLLKSFLSALKMNELKTLGDWHYWADPSATISRKKFDKELRHFCSESKL